MNRDEFPTCPRCQSALDAVGTRWVCASCKGMLVTEPEISQLIADMLGSTVSALGWHGRVAEPQPLKLEDRVADAAPPTCPRCTAAMAPRTLYSIQVDRCDAHGIWFDSEELETALRGAASAERQRSSVGEKVFGGALVVTYIAGMLAQLLLGGMR